MTETTSRPADHVGTPRARGTVTALRATSVLSVATILWQSATAGEILMEARAAYDYHAAGAIVLHVFSGLAAIAAFFLWRRTRGARWPTVVATLVFAASFYQAWLGNDESMWAHVPGAMILMIGATAVAVRAFLPQRVAAR